MCVCVCVCVCVSRLDGSWRALETVLFTLKMTLLSHVSSLLRLESIAATVARSTSRTTSNNNNNNNSNNNNMNDHDDDHDDNGDSDDSDDSERQLPVAKRTRGSATNSPDAAAAAAPKWVYKAPKRTFRKQQLNPVEEHQPAPACSTTYTTSEVNRIRSHVMGRLCERTTPVELVGLDEQYK